jgi:type IV pilus assembly protein PilQ
MAAGTLSGEAEPKPEENATQANEKATPATQLQYITTFDTDRGTRIHMVADGTISDYEAFAVDDPSRIVFDIFGIKSPYKKEKLIHVNSKWVNQIRYFGHPDKVRLVMDLNPDLKSSYLAEPDKDGLTVFVGEELPQQLSAAKTETSMPTWVNRIDFLSEDDGKSTIIIGTTQMVEYDIKKVSPKKLWLTLLGANLPSYRKNPLVTTRFESAVDRIIPVQTPAMKDRSIITIELRETVPYLVEQQENLVLIHFEASTIPPKPLELAQLPSWKQVMEETSKEAEAQATVKIGEPAAPGEVVQYTGEKIALDFYETDIKNVFRIIKEISGKNFAIDHNVKGKVTLSFDKPVPWDRVLDLVLKMNKLGKTYEGEIIRIATLGTLDEEETKRLARMQKRPLETAYIMVNYAQVQQEVLPLIQAIMSDRGKLSVHVRTNQIIMTDVPDRIERAKEIVKQIDRITPQVMIEARIIEASKEFERNLGIAWNASGGPIFKKWLGGAYKWGFGVNGPISGVPGTAPVSGFGFSFTKFLGSPFDLDLLLLAEEANQNVTILSAPKISTSNNKAALISQGLEYPYLERDESGLGTVQFKQIDLELKVTPQITNDNRIFINVKIKKDDIVRLVRGEFGSEVPVLETNKAETELLVNDGDTIVIGGIMKRRTLKSETGFPWLMNIPVLGWLFKAAGTEVTDKELIVFITPTIVDLESSLLQERVKF